MPTHQIKLVYLNSRSLLNYKDYLKLDCSKFNCTTLNFKIRFLLKVGPVALINYPLQLIRELKELDLTNPLIVYVETKTVTNQTVEFSGQLNPKEPRLPRFISNSLVKKWFFYWLKKGVFKKSDEFLFYKLSF